MNRRLYRSVADRRIGGVAAGTAAYFDIDPSISRVLWLVLAFFTGGVFLIIYLVMWAVVPEEPFAAGAAPGSAPASDAGASAPSGGKRGAKAATGSEAGPAPAVSGTPPAARGSEGPGGRVILGAILILIGGWFLAREFLPWLDFDFVWPVALVVAGILILAAALRRPA